jgi:hypothetical protein
MTKSTSLRKIRLILLFFVIALFVSGATAIPLNFELQILDSLIGDGTFMSETWPALSMWISRVHGALEEMSAKHEFLAYGYDWLAFGHFIIAIIFVGAIKDPVRNRWIVEAGMIACVLIIPYAIVFGKVRGIPIMWTGIDTLFGIFGILPLWYARRLILLEEMNQLEA